jgi:type IV pilus assembly protein PilF
VNKRLRLYCSALLIFALLVGCTSTGPGGTRNPSQNVKLDSKAAEINMRLGLNYMQRGDYKVALDKLQRALKQDPYLPSAHNTIGILYQRLGEMDKAEHHFKQAVQRAPDYSEAQNNYGVFLCQQNRYLEAEQRFLDAMKNPLYSNVDQALENAGICVGLIPDATLAEQYFRKALQINPNLSKSLLQMAELKFLNIDYVESKSYLERYQAISPWTARALLLAIKIENKLADKDAVASYSLVLRARFPDSDEALQVKKGQY